MASYVFTPGAQVAGVNPDIAGRSLQRMLRTGPLTAGRVLNAARRESHPLHPAFNWDDASAAEEYRLTQARHLIRSVRVTKESGESEPIAVHVVHEKCGGSAYVATAEVVTDQDLHAAALEEALKLLGGIARRYRYLQELSDVWDAIADLRRDPIAV